MSAVAAATPRTDVTSPEAYAARLYERHSRAVYGLCLNQLRRREDADDAVQTTFIYALLSLRRGVVPELELPWLFTIARNVCSTRRRSGMRRGAFEAPHDLDTIQDKLATPDRSDVATSEDFRNALRAIPESQRRALLLREWKGLSYDEIGTELGLSQAATEALLFRARQNVAQRLGGKAGRASLNGLPFFSFLRNLFQTAAAKTIAVGTGAALTIVAIPAAERAVPDGSTRAPVAAQTQSVRTDVTASADRRTPIVRAGTHRTSHRPAISPTRPMPAPPEVTASASLQEPPSTAPDATDPPRSPVTPPPTADVSQPTTVATDPIGSVIETTTDVGAALGLPEVSVSVPPVTIPSLPVSVQLPVVPDLPSVDLP